MADGVLMTTIHGVIRPTPTTGQTFTKPTATAPIQIGPKGGIRVEGIDTNAPANSVTSTDYTVSNVSQLILAANPNRNSNMIQNNGNKDIFLQFDAAAVANVGVTIKPNVAWESNTVFLGDVYAITASGSSRVTVLES